MGGRREGGPEEPFFEDKEEREEMAKLGKEERARTEERRQEERKPGRIEEAKEENGPWK